VKYANFEDLWKNGFLNIQHAFLAELVVSESLWVLEHFLQILIVRRCQLQMKETRLHLGSLKGYRKAA